MISLTTGKSLWSHELETVRAVLPLDDETFMVVRRHGLQKISADGTVLLDKQAPEKVKTVYNPVFEDLNGDGWLDIPAATGGSAGRWLSGKTGAVIVEVGAALENPLVGDWDGNGKLELFWWNNWHEIEPAKKKKKK